MSHREALQTVAIAANCVLDADRDNHIHIRVLSTVATGESIPKNQQWASPVVNLEEEVNIVEADIYAYADSANISNLYNQQLTINGTVDVILLYDQPALNVTITVTGGTVNTTTQFVNGAILNITAAGTVTISVTGYALEASSRVHKVISASKESSDPDAPVSVKNPLVTSESLADSISSHLLSYYAERLLFEVSNRGNPALETGDIITIVDDFGTAKTTRITKQELKYNGVLLVRSTTKGMV